MNVIWKNFKNEKPTERGFCLWAMNHWSIMDDAPYLKFMVRFADWNGEKFKLLNGVELDKPDQWAEVPVPEKASRPVTENPEARIRELEAVLAASLTENKAWDTWYRAKMLASTRHAISPEVAPKPMTESKVGVLLHDCGLQAWVNYKYLGHSADRWDAFRESIAREMLARCNITPRSSPPNSTS